MSAYDRRTFLRTLSAAALAGASFGTGCATHCPPRPWTPTAGRRVLADLHVHADLNNWNAGSPLAVEQPELVGLAQRALNRTSVSWAEAHRAGIDLMCIAHFNVFDEWFSMPTDPSPDAPFNTLRMLDQLEDALDGPLHPYATLARNRAALARLTAVPKTDPDYRIAVVHTLEGGHALGGELAPLAAFARRGVAMMTITHFFNKGVSSAPNAFPFFLDSNSRRPALGLTAFGRDLIPEMERLGMIVDVTHLTATAMDDVLKLARNPLVATHAAARTLADNPYALYDEQLVQIAQNGGLIGVILYPYVLSNFRDVSLLETAGSLRDVVRTIRYLVKICGTHRCIGIGSDFAGFIPPANDMRCLHDVGQLRTLLLQEFGGDQALVEDLLANNTLRFLQTNWKTGSDA